MEPNQSGSIPENDESAKTASEVTLILQAINSNNSNSVEKLIPVVYDELRRLASYHISNEKPGQTLQATALVHEAYLRLLDSKFQAWRDKRHFFGAAAEAMRRILVENARRKASLKRGGNLNRTELHEADLVILDPTVDILDLNEALGELEQEDPSAAEVVNLRFFTGLTWEQIAQALEVSPRTAFNSWTYGKAWLYERLRNE